jgi:hypothetical protein
VKDLRLPYRILIAEQAFVIVHCHVSELTLETQQIRPIENRSCPQCDGSGQVPMHGGLRLSKVSRGWMAAAFIAAFWMPD